VTLKLLLYFEQCDAYSDIAPTDEPTASESIEDLIFTGATSAAVLD
jgi:hypothetical protein